MGNAESDHGESKAYDIIKWIPLVNVGYGTVRSIVYAGKGNPTEALDSIKNAAYSVNPVAGPVLMVMDSRMLTFAENWMNWTELTFKAGDVIHCQLAGPWAYHVLMATSDKDVIHFIGDINSNTTQQITATHEVIPGVSGTGYVTEESFETFQKTDKVKGAQLTTCWNAGQEGREYTVEDSINRARAYLSKGKIYYNLLTCNCEHMVWSWIRGGTPYSLQSSQHVVLGVLN